MGGRLVTVDVTRKVGVCCVPFRGGGELGPYLTQCRLAEAYLRTKWHPDPSNRLATIHQRYRQENDPVVAQGGQLLATFA